MPIVRINDSTDPRLAEYRHLRERDLHGREGVFIGEQPLIVERMLAMDGVTRSVLVIEGREAWLKKTLAALGREDVECFVAPRDVVATIAGFDVHRGILAAGNRRPFDHKTLGDVLPPLEGPATVLCCESINNIDNIGALFRIGAAFGVDAILLDEACHDPLYRKSLRVSIGHALAIPFVRSTSWSDDLESLKDQFGCTLIGAATTGTSLHHCLSQPPKRLAVIMGGEFDGLTAATLALCNHTVRIPMAPGVDSLNVGVAAAIMLDRLSPAERR
jgi:tRNA G18 (ribose-2'-O)-methylase SpoU